MPQKMRIDRAVDNGEAQPRHEMILELFPDVFGVRFFVFHDVRPERSSEGAAHQRTETRGLLKNVFRGHSERGRRAEFASSDSCRKESASPGVLTGR